MLSINLKLVVLIFVMLFASRATAIEITLCENAIPPWVIEDDGEISKHSLLRIFTDKVFQEIEEIEVKYKLLPWRRCQEQVKQGKVDGTLFMYMTEEREKTYSFSDVTIEYPEGFLYSKVNYPLGIEINQYTDLIQYRIGLLRGHSYHPQLIKLKDQGKLRYEVIENSEQSLKMLAAGRIDIMVEGLINAKYYLSQKKLTDKVGINQGELIFLAQMAYSFHKLSPAIEYLPLINQKIKALRDQNFHIELLQRNYFTQSNNLSH